MDSPEEKTTADTSIANGAEPIAISTSTVASIPGSLLLATSAPQPRISHHFVSSSSSGRASSIEDYEDGPERDFEIGTGIETEAHAESGIEAWKRTESSHRDGEDRNGGAPGKTHLPESSISRKSLTRSRSPRHYLSVADEHDTPAPRPSGSNISPTAVYSAMLGANSIVSNSISLQATRLPNPPTLIEHGALRFLIMDAPSQSNLQLYLREMERTGVCDVVRVCEPTYSRERVEAAGIAVHDWVFPDGESPPEAVITAWLALVERRCFRTSPSTDSIPGATAIGVDASAAPASAIAVHCVAGLGRAPVLVAIALIEAGMQPLDAISFIRQRRRGAINNKQLKFLLESYKRHGGIGPRTSNKATSNGSRCLLM